MANSDPSPKTEPRADQPAENPSKEPFSLLAWIRNNPIETALFAGILGVLLYFYGIKPYYGNVRELSPIQWMWNVCGKPDFDYMHGRLIPLIIAGLVWYRWPQLKAAEKGSERWGLVIAIIGILFFIVAARVVQARIAAGSLPIVAFGLIAYIWGRHVARYLFFPCCLIYFAIPMPGLMQATNNLQIFSTETAAFVGGLFGIELHSAGSQIHSVPADRWQFEVDTGCSGIRSLVALTLIAAIYGHLTQDRLWKKIVLIVAALPLAVLANAGRVTTIVLIAEFINAKFASSTWHNWSGFIFFLAFGLSGLLLLSMLINGGFTKRKRKSVRTRVVEKRAAG